MPVKQTITSGKAPVYIYTDEIESEAYKQLENLSRMPFIAPHVAAMPDVHCGIGATVGAVIPTEHAIIPAAVGVDIGCGMNAVRLSLHAGDLPDSLRAVRNAIETAIPLGFDAHNTPRANAQTLQRLKTGIDQIMQRHPAINKLLKNVEEKWTCQLGTLGGGNHFIELCLDEEQRVWVMLHSGSRGIGNAIGRYFIALAKNDMQQHLYNLPDKDLAYFSEGAQHFQDYVAAVHWAQDYAMQNRREMMRLILSAIKTTLPEFELTDEAINCHHNYVAIERHFGKTLFITRKGAIRAGYDELGIIPGSMGTKSFIVRGRGNAESFCSCSHGAGRRMSRTAAKKRFKVNDLLQQTEGVECRKDKHVLDEIPSAYKDIDRVMSNQSDLVEIVHTLKQVVCVKG